ncbi:hypothetical protein CPB84DRAFT_1751769 [Gymnopilus junonius]|uniref:Uncharacterized protein n=1 Tax=Gymnopilus junonius TaxID=109634 RepID=A0A9P5NEL7_GYMJU|nr:hypothetical protein CPB84DRAFT_1751769 [Gymnopilus junonius]
MFISKLCLSVSARPLAVWIMVELIECLVNQRAAKSIIEPMRSMLCMKIELGDLRMHRTQLEEITSFLSANTLADNVSGTSAGAGGHLWARCTPEGDDYSDETLPDNDTLHEHSGTSTRKSQTVRSQRDCKQKKARSPSPHASPWPTTQEVRIVSLLSVLCNEVDKFGKEVSSQLDRLEPPSFSGPPPPIPLVSSFEELQSFKDHLRSITLRGQNSVMLQQDISKTLHLIEESLEGGEKQWNQELEKIRKEQSPQQGIAFDTG